MPLFSDQSEDHPADDGGPQGEGRDDDGGPRGPVTVRRTSIPLSCNMIRTSVSSAGCRRRPRRRPCSSPRTSWSRPRRPSWRRPRGRRGPPQPFIPRPPLPSGGGLSSREAGLLIEGAPTGPPAARPVLGTAASLCCEDQHHPQPPARMTLLGRGRPTSCSGGAPAADRRDCPAASRHADARDDHHQGLLRGRRVGRLMRPDDPRRTSRSRPGDSRSDHRCTWRGPMPCVRHFFSVESPIPRNSAASRLLSAARPRRAMTLSSAVLSVRWPSVGRRCVAVPSAKMFGPQSLAGTTLFTRCRGRGAGRRSTTTCRARWRRSVPGSTPDRTAVA